MGEDGEDRGDRRRGLSRRSFEGDLRADARFERMVLWRGVAITVGVIVIVVVRGLLL